MNPNSADVARSDAAEVRRIRMNTDLIALFKRPCPPGTTPTAKGIGLYTHIEGPERIGMFPHERYLLPEPVFLPIGGPMEVKRIDGTEPEISIEVEKLWDEVRDAVHEEETIMGSLEPGINALKERYGALELSFTKTQPQGDDQAQRIQLQQQDAAMQEDITMQSSEAAPKVGRKASLESSLDDEVGKQGDAAAGRKTLERKGSTTSNKGTRNFDASRDPRQRGR